MKTIKLIAIAFILGIVSLGYAQKTPSVHHKPDQNFQSILVPLSTAMQNDNLVAAMRAQLTPDFLDKVKPSYTLRVRFSHSFVYVIGSYAEWKKFFLHSFGKDLADMKSILIPLKDAVKDRNLSTDMREQLTPDMLSGDKSFYIAPVEYKKTTVYIGGSLTGWKDFFLSH